MIAAIPPRVRIVTFQRIGDDLSEPESLLARVHCVVNGEHFVPTVVYREANGRLVVAMMLSPYAPGLPADFQPAVARVLERHIRFLIREEARDA